MSYPEWSDKPSEMVAMLRNAAMDAVLGQGGLVGQTLYARAADALHEMERVLADLRDNGLRFDLHPTMVWSSEYELHAAYCDYIKRMDERAREIGRNVLQSHARGGV